MPELPEVETIKNGIEPFVTGQKIIDLVIRRTDLRWPIPANLPHILKRQSTLSLDRRGKYLLFKFTKGYLLIHLGMSGRLQIVKPPFPPYKKHDHVDFIFANHCLRYHDPRRFGAILWTEQPPQEHVLLRSLGIEPLSKTFDTEYLYTHCQRLSANIKNTIMNHKIVVGVGNIYAAEALFQAKIHPQRPSRELTGEDCQRLVAAIKKILQKAIKAGGTTLKDFYNGSGKPGYFQQALQVYGREGQLCYTCQSLLQKITLQQRATVFCPQCQR